MFCSEIFFSTIQIGWGDGTPWSNKSNNHWTVGQRWCAACIAIYTLRIPSKYNVLISLHLVWPRHASSFPYRNGSSCKAYATFACHIATGRLPTSPKPSRQIIQAALHTVSLVGTFGRHRANNVAQSLLRKAHVRVSCTCYWLDPFPLTHHFCPQGTRLNLLFNTMSMHTTTPRAQTIGP